MNVTYFNYRIHIAETGWDRRGFVAQWWRVYAGDSRWVPPYFPALRHELEPANNSHLARMAPVFIHLDALPRSQARPGRGSQPLQGLSTGALFEEPVATAIVLCDPRRQDGTAHLALLHCANDTESLERLVERLAEILWVNRCRRVIGPTGLSPHLETGLLQDHWDQLPPLHTPYNPPYLPEVVSGSLRPLGRSQLYHLDIPPELPPAPPARAQMVPLEPARLATNLLPLLAAACPTWADFPPPDAEEAAFLLRWLSPWPLFGWLAQVDAQPVGFILVQPDLAPTLRKSNGGRNLLWRPWLAWAGRRPVRQGRVLFGAVLPEWQGQGIGRQLLHHALVTGYNRGWQSVSIGPVPGRAPACAFLEHHGARSQQTYWLYQQDL